MIKNRMAEVAAMFGKKLNEPFKISYLGDNHSIVFREDGTHQLNDYPIDFDLLHVLLTGQAEIVEG